jgi:hypothetical protein
MKRILLALLLFLSLQSIAQQQWIAQGSVWHYSYWNIMESGLYELSYNTDTVIDDKTCQKIESKQWYFNQIFPPPNPPTVTGPTLSSFFTYFLKPMLALNLCIFLRLTLAMNGPHLILQILAAIAPTLI